MLGISLNAQDNSEMPAAFAFTIPMTIFGQPRLLGNAPKILLNQLFADAALVRIRATVPENVL